MSKRNVNEKNSSKYVTGDIQSLDLSKLLDKIKKDFAIKSDRYESEDSPSPVKSESKGKPN